MDNRGFFSILNKFYKGKAMQFVPAFLSSTAPPFPYATFQVRSSDSGYIRLDEKDQTKNKIIHKATARVVEELIIKCYHKSDEDAYKLSREVMDLINFKYKSEINKGGYGIILVDTINTAHEKTDNGWIYCYPVMVTIDYNHTTTREYDKLKVIEISGDIEEIINMEVK